MPPGFHCVYCGNTNGTSDFTYNHFAVNVRIIGKTPVETYRHGPRKGEPKETAWDIVLYESPTHYYDASVQGIRNEKACESIVRKPYDKLVSVLQTAGYTEVRVVVSAVGVNYDPF